MCLSTPVTNRSLFIELNIISFIPQSMRRYRAVKATDSRLSLTVAYGPLTEQMKELLRAITNLI